MSSRHNRIKLPNVARISDQFGVSDRAAAAVATATLQDYGVVTKEDPSNVNDRSKLRRARVDKRLDLQLAAHSESILIAGLYFDGRKDKTLVLEQMDGKYHRRTATEEHISLIQEPQSLYLGHITPQSGSAENILKEMRKYFTGNGISLEKLVAVGCDGTSVNTGNKNGVIRKIEVLLKRPVQWFVCQLHANELPLRILFQELDGATTGPQSYLGPIGKALANCEHLGVVDFVPIHCDLPKVTSKLSADQKYLYDICEAISKGECTTDLANRDPGRLSIARWLTMANRMLRLYVATSDPSTTLRQLVEYVLKVYSPVWFAIKMQPSCKDGARHVWKTVQLSRKLEDSTKAIIDPVIERNAYFCHSENLLLAMLTDDRQHI